MTHVKWHRETFTKTSQSRRQPLLINFENEIVEIVVARVGWKRAWKPGEGGDLSGGLWQEDRGKSVTYPFKGSGKHSPSSIHYSYAYQLVNNKISL